MTEEVKPHRRMTAHQRRAVSVRAAVDPRTLEKYLRGEPIRSTCEARIRVALLEMGVNP